MGDNNLLSDFNGVSLSGGDILVNPDLDLARELKGWWDSEGCKQEMSSITVAGARGGDGGSQGPAKIIGEVKQDNLGYGDKGDYYNTVATVTFFRWDPLLIIGNVLTDCLSSQQGQGALQGVWGEPGGREGVQQEGDGAGRRDLPL